MAEWQRYIAYPANLYKEAAKSALAEAKKQLVGKHVDIPNYYSET